MTTEEILARLDLVRRAGSDDKWMAACPAHDDRKASLSVRRVADGRTLLNDFAGCTQEQIVAALGLTMADLFVNGSGSTAAASGAPPQRLTLEAFAQAKGLPVDLLVSAGIIEERGSLRFTYRLPDGTMAPRHRHRRALADPSGWWDGSKDAAVTAYGLWHLEEALERGELLLVEGESDAITAWHHNLPCLGIPGADMVTSVLTDDVLRCLQPAEAWAARVETLWIIKESDRGGDTFVERLATRLGDFGWSGRALVVSLPGAKDLNELHLVAGARFADEFARAKAEAVPLELAQTSAPTEAVDRRPTPQLLGEGAGQFLARTFPPREAYIEGLLAGDGGGWIGGEEKLGKTFFALEEALCLAYGLPVCGRFVVPVRRRVLFLEEEDSPRRSHGRLSALLRGHDLDPANVDVRAELDVWFRIAVWDGFTFQDPAMIARLEATIADFLPAVAYIDVLRKVTAADLNKATEASAILAILDRLRRRYGVIFRMLHHNRKVQGFRSGRGSQELGGSFVLGAWGESSLFFEPVGRKHGAVRVEVQSKDAAPVPAFRLVFEAEGPRHAPTLVRLKAEEDRSGEDADEVVHQAIATLPKTESLAGKAGVTVQALATALKRSDKTVRRSLKRLQDSRRVVVTGQAAKGKDLYGVSEP